MSVLGWVAIACLASATWSAFPVRRTGTPPISSPVAAGPRHRARGWWLILPMAGVPVVLWWLAGGRVGSVSVVLLVVGSTVGWVVRHRVRSARELGRAAEVARAGELIAAELMLGKVPRLALMGAAEDCALLREAVTATRVGVPVPQVWLQQARRPGLQNLAVLARAWTVAEVSGAALAPTLHQVAENLRADAEHRREVAAELAASRMTGVVLALLPVAGIALGYAIGGDPVQFLLANSWGQAALVAGAVCACTGLVWTERLGVGGST